MSLPELYRIAQVVFGIGLVIFVHEAGHFLAARWCGVRVEVFSLGFGPRLFGWRRGATLYQVALIPVGGFVKMAGEMPDGTGRPPRPDDLHGKSVGQRFFIYSGGVIMNLVFALAVFPMVLAAGVPVVEPVIDAPAKGTPAWHARLAAGTRILAVGGDEVWDFHHIPSEVALAEEGPLELTLVPPGASEPTTLSITPVYNERGGFRQIGVRPGVDPDSKLWVDEEGPAAAAGLSTGDSLVRVVGGVEGQSPYEQYLHARDGGQPLEVVVRRGGTERTVEVAPVDGPRLLVGIGPWGNLVLDQRDNPWLAALELRERERIASIDGRVVSGPSDFLEALVGPPAATPGEELSITIERTDPQTDRVTERVVSAPRPPPVEAVEIERDLYLGFDPDSTLIFAQPGRPAALAGIRTGDRMLRIGGADVASWPDILRETQRVASSAEPATFRFERRVDNHWEVHEVTVSAAPEHDYGFGLRGAVGVHRTTSVGESIREGFVASWRFLTDAWLTLQKMFLRQISTENLGGILTIGAVSYDWAALGWSKLFFFLCMLSINLAFLNVLPIPVLDGGHLFFCLVEAVKGSPVSERTLGYSQIVGLVLIVTLMVYVTYQDVMRFLPGGP